MALQNYNKFLYDYQKVEKMTKKIETCERTSLHFYDHWPDYSAFASSAAGASATGASSALGASAAFFLPPRRVVLVALAAFLPLV